MSVYYVFFINEMRRWRVRGDRQPAQPEGIQHNVTSQASPLLYVGG